MYLKNAFSARRLILVVAISIAVAWFACAKNDASNESTTPAQTTMPTLNFNCGSGACIQ